MRHLLISALLSLTLLLSGCVIYKPKVLAPLCDYPGTALRIPSSTLKMTGMMADDGDGFIRKLNTVEVFSCDNRRSMDAVVKASCAIAESRGMELMIEARDSAEVVHIYTVESDRSGVLKEMLIQALEPGECNVVYIKGEIDIASLSGDSKDFKKLLKGSI